MYQHNNHSAMTRLSPQQQVSLDKHQEMIDSALKWQQHSEVVESEPSPQLRTHVQRVFATLWTMLTTITKVITA